MTHEEIRKLVAAYFERTLAEEEDARADGGTEGSAQESRYGYSRCPKDDLRINGERGGK